MRVNELVLYLLTVLLPLVYPFNLLVLILWYCYGPKTPHEY